MASDRTAPRNGCLSLLTTRPLLIFAALVILGVAGVLGQLSRVSSSLVRATALDEAARTAHTLAEIRTIYTSEVVARVAPHGITATHLYTSTERAIPLPASLTILLGDRINSAQTGGYIRLYSAYPFPFRANGGPHDDFERSALAALSANPDRPYYRFETFRGGAALRYATADRMRESCVACHNSHPDSPKRDWRVGDLRGVLEVVTPIDRVQAEVRSGLRETFLVIGGGSAVGLAVLGLVLGQLGATAQRLQTAKDSAEAAHGQLERESAERLESEAAETRLQRQVIELQDALLEELSAPFIPINRQIIVMPLIGRMTPERAAKVSEALLQGVHQSRARVAIIDLTGIRLADAAPVPPLLEGVGAAQLLGSAVILTGITPEMARAFVDLDVDLSRIPTCGTLQSGIELALTLAES